MQKPRKNGTILLLLILQISALAQSSLTTFIIVRHAEKDMSQNKSDPDLSPAGRARAERLRDLLAEADITGIFSTSFKRTLQTAEPLARHLGLPVRTYSPEDKREFYSIFESHRGKTVLITAHSNTVPQWLNFLVGSEKYQNLDDMEYGNVYIVSITEPGKISGVLLLKY
jgi:2,3-bisphosphoglycerate-dependent phosphoglycerate mutase